MRIGSLFSGIGGFELGLEWAGVGRTVWQVEIDPFCRAVLAHHWPDATRHEDVRTVGAHNLEPVDVICGGFPCQDISYAGKGAGLAGERSGLWYEFARIVGQLGPRYVVVENVAALLTRGIDAVLGTLADLGYDAEWSTLRASDVGAPHRRERVFLIAWRRALADADRQHGPESHVRQEQSEQHAPRRGNDSRCGVDVDNPHRGRREQRDAGERADAVVGAGHAALGDADRQRQLQRGGPVLDERGLVGHAGAELEHAEGDLRRQHTGGKSRAESESGREAQTRGVCQELRHPSDERFAIGCAGVGDADNAGPQGHGRPVDVSGASGWDATRRYCTPSGAIVGWEDATPVRGADGTVRLIPADAAARGPESPLWPVAHGIPGRVARLRAIGNAVVPQVAEVVGRRLLALDAMIRQERAA